MTTRSFAAGSAGRMRGRESWNKFLSLLTTTAASPVARASIETTSLGQAKQTSMPRAIQALRFICGAMATGMSIPGSAMEQNADKGIRAVPAASTAAGPSTGPMALATSSNSSGNGSDARVSGASTATGHVSPHRQHHSSRNERRSRSRERREFVDSQAADMFGSDASGGVVRTPPVPLGGMPVEKTVHAQVPIDSFDDSITFQSTGEESVEHASQLAAGKPANRLNQHEEARPGTAESRSAPAGGSHHRYIH